MVKHQRSYITRLRNCLCIPTSVSVVLLMAGSMLTMYYVANGWIDEVVEKLNFQEERHLSTMSSIINSEIQNKYQNLITNMLINQNISDTFRFTPQENLQADYPIYSSVAVTLGTIVPPGWNTSATPPSSPLGYGWFLDKTTTEPTPEILQNNKDTILQDIFLNALQGSDQSSSIYWAGFQNIGQYNNYPIQTQTQYLVFDFSIFPCEYYPSGKMERFDVRCRPYYYGAMEDTSLVHQTATYLLYEIYTGTTVAKSLKNGRGIVAADILNEQLFNEADLRLEGYEFFLTDKDYNVMYHKDYQGIQNVIRQIADVEIGINAPVQLKAEFTELVRYAAQKSRVDDLNIIINYQAEGEEKVAAVSSIHRMDLRQFGDTQEQPPTTSFVIGINTNKSNYLKNINSISRAQRDLIIVILLCCGGLCLISILFVFCISQMVAKRLIKPISDINSKLEHLMMQSEITRQIPRTSKEVQRIYKAILDAQTTLNFANNGFLKVNDTEALLDFAQAYTIFKKVDNKPAMLVCLNNIAVIHFKEARYTDSAQTFKEAILLSKQMRTGPISEAKPLERANFAFRMYMLALALYYDSKSEGSSPKRWHTARKYFKRAIKRLNEFESFLDFTILIQILISDTYLEEEAALLADQELLSAQQMLTNIERGSLNLLSRQPRMGISEIPLVILRQKLILQRARNFFSVQSYYAALVQLINFMEQAPIYDPTDRQNALDIIKSILEAIGPQFNQIDIIQEMRYDAYPSRKDIVVVYNYSERLIVQKASRIAQKLALHVREAHIDI